MPKEVNHMAACTACSASSICGSGNESLMEIVLSLQKSTQRQISPVFFLTIITWDAYGLLDGQIISALSHPSKHFFTSNCNWIEICVWGKYTGLSVVVGILCFNQSQNPNLHHIGKTLTGSHKSNE